MNNLQKMSWEEIIAAYRLYGRQMDDYLSIAHIFGLELPLTEATRAGEDCYIGAYEDFLERFHIGVDNTTDQLRALDTEISRRNRLIGVV